MKFEKLKPIINHFKEGDYFKMIHHFTIGLDILFVFLLLFDFLKLLPSFWNMTYVWFFVVAVNTLFLALKINKVPEEKRSKSKMIYYFSHFFLLSLVVIVINQFLKRQIIIDFMPEITAVSIALGFLTFFAYRNKVERDIEKENNDEREKEEKRKEEFGKKFPRLNKIPVLRSFVKWMYKEGWVYVLLLVLIIISGTIIQLSFIGNTYFWTDEVFSFNAGKMILEKGVPLYDSGLYYDRAPIYHYLMAGSMHLFGLNEFGSRVINVFFNILSALAIYLIIRKKSKGFALLGSTLFLTSNLMIAMTIETRFYTMFSFLYLMSAIAFYYAFLDKTKLVNKIKIKKFSIEFNFKWLLAFLFFFYLAFNTHTFFFILIFGIFLYSFYQLIIQKPNFKNILLFLLMILLIFAGSYSLTGTFDLKYSYFEARTLDWARDNQVNITYYIDILKENISFYSLIFIISFIFILIRKNKLINYLFLIIIASLYFISNQKAQELRYLSFIFPMIFLFITLSFTYLFKFFNKKFLIKIIILGVIIFFLCSNINLYYNEINQSCGEKCLSENKYLQFYEVIEYLKENNNSKIIADWHSVFTLMAQDIEVDYIIYNKEKTPYRLNYATKIDNNYYDMYFNIPLLEENDENYYEKISENSIIVIRNKYLLNKIPGKKLSDFEKPSVYLN
jgi:4-amino-4-deoxy-L-arabinose transferase-like glycosyltransferase